MYRIYDKDGKNRELMEKSEHLRQKMAADKAEEDGKKRRILLVSLVIGLVPVVVVGGNVIRKQTWVENPRGTVEALAIVIAGGAALFALNYGWFYLKYLEEEVFVLVFSFAFVLLLIALAFYLARKKNP